MYRILNVTEYNKGIHAAIKYIHVIWGNKRNFTFYKDAIVHSSQPGKHLPHFYLM